jgi:hypothetical protein
MTTIQPRTRRWRFPSPWRDAGTAEPRRGAFDDRALGQNDKARQVGTSNDFDCQPINVRDRCFKLLPGIAAIGIQSGERGIRVAGSLDKAGCPVAVLNIGTVHHALEYVADCVGHDPAFASFIFLPALYPQRPPASMVFTD